jgi:TonB family protein
MWRDGMDYSAAMRFLCGVLLVLVAPSCLVAQTTEADLSARLVKAPLYLRGQWSDDNLAFDDAGKLNVTSAVESFTLSGVEVQSARLTSKKLVLEGQRVGLEFDTFTPRRVGLVLRGKFLGTKPEKMTITIDRPADGNFKAPLDAIFADNLADLVPELPACWQAFAQKHLLPPDGPPSSLAGGFGTASTDGKPRPAGLAKIGGTVRPPQLVAKVDPRFSDGARALKFSGIALVNLIVDPTGMPRNVHILRPAGLGLDENAVAAVEQYTFKPAMEDGKPVAVELNVEVNYQIF